MLATGERERLKELEREVRELRKANALAGPSLRESRKVVREASLARVSPGRCEALQDSRVDASR